MNRLLLRLSPVIMLSGLLLAGCSGGGGGSTDGTPAPTAATDGPPAPTTVTTGIVTVTGKVKAPNGTDPISGADVYVPESATTKTTTAANGSFSLKVPTGTQTLVISKGLFQLTLSNLSIAKDTDLPENATTLAPVTSEKAKVPRIAVIRGNWDSMENVLAKMGLKEFAVIDGNTISSGPTELAKYDIIFVDCGADEAILSDNAAKANLKAYVENGGRIFVADWAYDYVEQTFPAYIRWDKEGDTTPLTAALIGVAKTGTVPPGTPQYAGITANATINDANLKAWLNIVKSGDATTQSNTLPTLKPDGTIDIGEFQERWIIILGSHLNGEGAMGAQVSTYLEGNVNQTGTRPLAVSFPVGTKNGRVTYFSNHISDTNHPYFTPQERVLEYLLFE